MTAAPELREQVGPYRVLRAIGSGGTARIDLARIDRAYNFQRHVVIKRPLEHLRTDDKVAASLQREAKLGGKLHHPNLIAMLDAGMHDGYDYLVLEYVHGCSLRTLMQTEVGQRVRAVPLAVALGIVIDVARGLHDAHELRDDDGSPLGLVHRDVSPGNVLLGLDGAVKLADFGIAKETRVATLSGSMHGTVTYMAPEQCRGHAFDRRADVFSLGVILYELVTHQRLFWADNDVASLHKVLSGHVERARKLEPAVSVQLEEIVMTAVAHEQQHRFASARELADALEALAAAEGHVVGARFIARTMEDVVGKKQAPWVSVPSVPATRAERKASEHSLMSVIEATPPEIGVDLTFGPSDDRLREEGSVPSAPSMQPKRAPSKSTRATRIVLALGMIGVFASAALMVTGKRADDRIPSPPKRIEPAPSPPAPEITPQPIETPPAELQGSAVDEADIVIDEPAEPTKPPRRRPKHAKQPVVVAPPPVVPVVPAPAQGSGSAAKPPHVEWKPTMLMPTDSGSGKSK